MRLKVRGGTAMHGGQPLCHTCRYATIVRGSSLNEEIIECGRLFGPNQVIRFAVTFCTQYLSKEHPTLRDMEDIAWVLRSDTKKNTVGFVRSRDLALKHRFVLDEDDY